jgi:hypothetical protein
MRNILKRVAIALVLLYIVCVIGMAWVMRQPPEKFGKVMSHTPVAAFIFLPFETLWKDARAGQLRAGDAAPDFSLNILDTTTPVRLSSFRDKQPVVLIFGSYT